MNKPTPQLAKEQKQIHDRVTLTNEMIVRGIKKKSPIGIYKGRPIYDESEIDALKANCEKEIKTLKLVRE